MDASSITGKCKVVSATGSSIGSNMEDEDEGSSSGNGKVLRYICRTSFNAAQVVIKVL